MKPRQITLIPHPSSEHGGAVRTGKRKIRRPVAVKKPMHIVFRASRARGDLNFLRTEARRSKIRELVYDTADRFTVKILGFENVGNHLHLITQVKHRKALQSFLRVLPQRIMFLVTGAKKGTPKGRLFDHVAYSKIVTWGKELKALKRYLFKNTLEALGISRSQAKHWFTLTATGVEPCG